MFKCCFRTSLSFLATLYEGAVLLLTTGLIGTPGLWSFSWAFSVGGEGFLCIKCLICLL